MNRRSARRRQLTLTIAVLFAVVVGLFPQALPGVETPAASAHNLQTKMVYMFLDEPSQALLDTRLAGPWTPGDPILQAGDEIGLVIKVVPRDGTTTGVGGHVDFYVPNGVTVTDAAYVIPDGSGGFVEAAMKGQSPIAIGDGPIGAKTTSQLIGMAPIGPNINGVTSDPVVPASGLHRGTIAGVYGDTGIFYSTDPDTSFGSWQRFSNPANPTEADRCGLAGTFPLGGAKTITNNSGDTFVPCNKWDAEQMYAWGVKGTTYTGTGGTSTPIVDYGDGRGNAPWGFASGVAGPQSGYAWFFDWDEWRAGPMTAADMKAAMDTMGPWQRAKYPGSRISFDQPGLDSTTLGFANIDGSTVGVVDLKTADLAPTVSQTDATSPKTIRWAVGQLTSLRPEYVWVQFKVDQPNGSFLNADGCPLFHADTFGGDAGGTDNGKDHLWRYYEPSTVTWNGCLAAGKPATVEFAAKDSIFSYKIKVYNLGHTTQTNVVVRDTLGSGLTFISASPPQNSGPNPLIWNIGTLQPNQKFEATLTVKATGTGYLDNCLDVTSDQGATSTCDTTVGGAVPYLVPTKSVLPISVAPGGTVQYSVLVRNIGSGPSSNPTVIDEMLAAGFTYLSKDSVMVNGANVTATTTVNSSNPNNPIFTVPAGINSGQNLLIKFTAQIGANVVAGEYCNTYSVISNGVPLTTGSLACMNVGGSAIGDTLYRDWNGNGVQDPTDEGLPNTVVNLYAGACTNPPSGTVIQTETTNANGNYLFDGLTAGTYCVETVYPSGYTVTADPDGGANGYSTVTLPTDQSQNLDQDFGFQPGGVGAVGDKVFDDQNNNGVFDAGDVGINGATVYLYEDTNGNGVIDPDDYLIGTQTTAGGGNYSFTGLAEDLDYLVKVNANDAGVDAYFANPYGASTSLLIPVPNLSGYFDEADFGFYEVTPSSIGDTVCIDVNNDGLCTGADTPLPDVEVRLYRDTNGNGVLDPGEPLLDTQVTNGSGNYTFAGLAPGSYIVDVVQNDPDVPGGYAPTQDLLPVKITTPGTTYLDADFPFVQTLRKEVVPTGPANANDVLTYKLYPNYPGSELLTDVVVADPIPAGTTYVGASANAGGTFAANTVQWNLGSNLAAIPGNNVGSFYCPAGPATAVASKDTYLDSSDVNANYGSAAVIAIDSDKVFDGLVQFTLPTLPGGAVFDRAELRLTVDSGQNADRTVAVHKLLKGPWTEGTSNNTCTTGAAWQGPNCTDDWLSAGGNFGTSDYAAAVLGTISPALNNTTYAVDVSSAYLDWVATPANNYGLALIATGSDNGTVNFNSRTGDAGQQPTLVVYYSLPTLGGCSATVKIYPQQDNYINAAKPNEVKNGTELLTKIDTDPAKVIRSLLQFDLSTLPAGATITAANFNIFATGTANQTVNIRALTDAWNESQATWNNRLTGTLWTTAGGDFSGTAYGSFVPSPTNNTYYATNVLSLVQAWYGGAVTNDGLILVPSGANSQAKFASSIVAGKQPYLEITYQSPFVTTDLIATQDAFIDAANVNSNNNGTELRTKYDTNTAKRKRTLVQFDLSSIPAGAVVDDAHFFINVKQVAAHTLNVRRLTSVWNEAQVTWNNRLTATPWTTPGGDTGATVYGTFTPNALGYVNTDVTSLAQGWFAGSFANDGLILVPVSGSNSEAKYDSSEVPGKEPFLRVRYQAPSAGGTRSNNMSAKGTLVTGGSQVKVRITLRAESAVTGVTPGTITPSGTNGASATCGSPTLISADANIAAASFATDPVVYEWTCTTTAGSLPGSVKFSATASGDAGATTFAAATTNTVLVSPILQFQVTVDAPTLLPQIENVGNIQSGSKQVYTQLTPNVCYVAGDEATDHMYSVLAVDGAATSIGNTGTTSLEGMTWNLAGTTLYGANGNQLGTFNSVLNDPASATFTARPNTIASVGAPLRGSLGNITVADVDGISFDPASGILYGVNRREDGNNNNTLLDVLIQINPTTGAAIQNAFGSGVDYIVIATNTLSPALYDVDDISFHPTTGALYGVADDSTAGVGDLDRLIIINKTTGAVTDVGRLTDTATTTGVDDMEGLSFLNSGDGVFLYGTTGSPPPTTGQSDRFWEIDPANGEVTQVSVLPAAHNDYEALACLPGDYEITTTPPVIPLTPSNEVITPLPTGSIGDYLWYDTDGDGIQDGGEPPVTSGGVLNLYQDTNNNGKVDPGEPILAVTTVDGSGFYSFNNLAPGNYVVKAEEQQVPAPPSSPNAGDIGRMVTTNGSEHGVNLAAGQVYTDADFGYIEGAELEGTVFHDVNHNGILEPGESGLPNVTVTLSGTDINGNPVTATTTTDADGEYSFIVPPGTYTISYNPSDPAIPPALSDLTTPTSVNLTVPAGAEVGGIDFGRDNAGKIGDRVWNDTANPNGVQDGGEPGIGGVTVQLYLDADGNPGTTGDQTLVATTLTSPTGAYQFVGLPDTTGSQLYLVKVNPATLPSGYIATGEGDPGTPCAALPGGICDNQIATTLTGGATINSVDFGYKAPPTSFPVSGRVWDDTDGNGSQNGGELGIPGVSVCLKDTNDNIVACTTTNGTGDYTFPGVPNGAYTIVVDPDTLPNDAYVQTGDPNASCPGVGCDDQSPIVVNGAPVTNQNFGYQQQLSNISGTVCSGDGNGLCDVSDPQQPGVQVFLTFAGPDGILGTPDDVVTSTTTNGSGNYSFPNLLPGTYSISTVAPTGYTNLADADGSNPNFITVNLLPNQNKTDRDFELAPLPGVIGDRVWLDENGNGVQDAGEAGIPNLLVTLLGTDINGNVVSLTTYTDLDGGYLFDNVPPSNGGGYTISVTPTAGLIPTYNEDTGTTAPNNTTTVVLTTNEEHLTADFGYNWVPPGDSTNPPPAATGAIGDRLWVDVDGDGVQDPGEPGLGGVPVKLLTDDNNDGVYDNLVATTTTAPDGSYIFDGVPPGSYVVQVNNGTTPPGYTQTGDPDGTLDNQSDPIVLAPGDVYVNADFGYQPDGGTTGSIGDTVWLDADRNNAQNAGEPGIAGVTVSLIKDANGNGVWDAGEPIIATDTTDANGNYSFAGLPIADGAGTDDYLVWVSDTNAVLSNLTPTYDADGGAPASGVQTGLGISAVSNLTATPVTNQDFAYAPPGQDPGDGLIGDTIFMDTGDGAGGAPNGTPDPGEGLQGVTVRVYASDGTTLLATTTTDENGQYFFGGLKPTETYVVKVDPATLPNGGAGLTNSIDPGDPTPNQSTVDLSTSGPIDLDQDFGYTATAPGAVSGTIWDDSNANGALQPGETGRYDGVTVALLDPNGNVVATTTTDSNGNYTFPNLPPGSYTVDVTDDGNVLDGTWHTLGTPDTAGQSQSDPKPVTVTTGQTTVVDFGYYDTPASIGDFVWDDLNGDGIQNGGEPGLNGVVVTMLVKYPNGGTTTVTTVTDSSGFYSFDNLLLDENYISSSGTATPAPNQPAYIISVATPAGYAPTLPNQGGDDEIDSDNPAGQPVAVNQGQFNDTVDFGFVIQPGSIGDRVWLDENGNGVQDAGEAGIPNLPVTLSGNDINGNPVSLTTYTDLDGGYLFADVLPSNGSGYAVTVTPTAGLIPTYDENGTGTPSTTNVVLVAGEVHDTADFGYNWVPPGDSTNPPSGATGAIGDRVWVDVNGDGVQDPGEPGLGGVPVKLYSDPDNDGVYDNLVATTTTAPDGSYIFDGVPPGSYVVQVNNGATPSGYAQTGDPDGTLDNATTSPVVLAPGDVYVNADFGYQPEYGYGNSIGDTVWLDVNRDGVQDPGEPNIPGVTVQLTWYGPDGVPGGGDNVIYTTTTDENGNYLFDNLPDGNFQVTTNLPVNTGPGGPLEGLFAASDASGSPTDGTSDVSLDPTHTAPGPVTNLDQDFGYSPNDGTGNEGVIGDTIFFDANGNGMVDPGEGIPGVKVTLSGAGSAVTYTDANGNYTFGNLGAGAYTVTVDPTTLPNNGAGLSNTIDPDGGTANQSAVTLATNSSVNLDQDFGYTGTDPLQNSIGDTVWLDANGNGVLDPGEPGIPGVLVQLTYYGDDGAPGGGDDVVYTTTTGEDGYFLFDNLPDGNFAVTVPASNFAPGGVLDDSSNPTYDADGIGTPNTSVVTGLGVGNPNPVNNLSQDFGYSPSAPGGDNGVIGDTIFLDLNGNGVADPGEGIPGVKVTLDGSTVVYTDANGNYTFGDLAAGSHTVVVDPVTLPGGLSNTTDPDGGTANQSTVNLPTSSSVNLDQDFGYRPTSGTGSIGDTVWLDADRNNAQNAGEPGIPGVTVSLIKDSNGNGIWDAGEPIIATDTTDANGNYSFAGLPTTDGAGTDDYLVWVSDTGNVLSNLVPTYDADGGAPASGVQTGLGISAVSNLTATPVTNQDFAYAPPGQDPGDGLIGDTIFMDTGNGAGGAPNGTADPGEGLQGVTVRVYASDGITLLATTTTDENGQYFFGGLNPTATYVVKVDPTTLPNGGAGLTNSIDPDGGTASQSSVNLSTSGPVNLNQDFGYTATAPGAVSGTIWDDSNGNGSLQPGETGRYGGVTVALLDPNGDVVATTTTAPDGSYIFPNLPPGSYTVDVTDDGNVLDGTWHTLGTPNTAGQSQTDPKPVTVTTGVTTVVDFGYYDTPASIGNFVWDDVNGNGIQNAGEPGINGVLVTLLVKYPNGATSTVTTLTGDNPATSTVEKGWYGFGNLLLDESYISSSGTATPATNKPAYIISVATPLGYSPTLLYQGSNDAVDSDNPAGQPAAITQGNLNETYDFGYVGAPPDITPIITAVPNVMTGPTPFNLTVRVLELNNSPTVGLITVRIPKDSRWTLAEPYNSGYTVLGVIPVNNVDWTFSEDASYYIFKMQTATIPASGYSTFGIKAAWDAGQTQGVYTITSQIVSGSGGENRYDNNSDAEKLDYFIN